VNKQLRTLCYSATLVISQLIAVLIFVECYHGSGFGNWIAVKLYQIFDDKILRLLLEIVSFVIAMIFAGLLFFMIFFRSGYSRWLKNILLRIFPDKK
jgi:preprotein translocase subunit SecG